MRRAEPCPECGSRQPIPRRRAGDGPRWRTRGEVLGVPVVDLAWGRRGRQQTGDARGVLAIGDRAFGLVAIGTDARGLVAIGTLARGLIALGGIAIAPASAGLAAIGILAVGWGAVGYLAKGSAAIGCYAGGGVVAARFARIGSGPIPPDLPAFVNWLDWLFASWPAAVIVPLMVVSAVAALAPLLVSVIVRASARRHPNGSPATGTDPRD